MSYALIVAGVVKKYSYSVEHLMLDNKNTSFPDVIPESLLSQYGCFKVIETTPPIVDYTKNVTEDIPVFKDGEWVQTWTINTASKAEKDERLSSAWSDLRNERNRRLAECDWTQLPDSSVDKAAWAAYRMALRFLPEATQDPFNPVWPVKPI